MGCSDRDVRGGWVVQRPDTNKLIQLMWTKDASVTRQIFKAVSDDGNEQIQHLTAEQHFIHRRTVWVKKSHPWNFLTFFPKRLGIFSPKFYLPLTRSYLRWTTFFLFNYLQLWWSYVILSATTIMCSKCPPSTETHAGWSHLIWHNFVVVGDNWIKICSLT